MEYKGFGQKIFPHLDPGGEVVECIQEVYRTERVASGKVSGLEAASEMEFRIFDTTEKKYCGKFSKSSYEAAFLAGSIIQRGEDPYLHLHMVIGNPPVGECHGGHLDRAATSTTAEIFITAIDGTAGRRMNEFVRLSLIEFTQA